MAGRWFHIGGLGTFQARGCRGPKKYRDMLLHTGTEEIGHIEVLATAVAMNLDGLPPRRSRAAPLPQRRPGRHALGRQRSSVHAACIDVGGNLLANMRANVAAEAVGRTLAARLREMTDDPGMKDMLSFLIARDSMHQQQWLAAIEDAGDTFNNAPNDVVDEGDYKQYAYQFLGHAEEPMAADARWLTGPSLDGRGEFSIADPAPRLGEEPELMGGPSSVHGGIEATRTNGAGDGGGIAEKVKETVAEKVKETVADNADLSRNERASANGARSLAGG